MKKTIPAILLILPVFLAAIPLPSHAYYKETPILKLVHCEDYVELGEPVWFQVGVENADKFRNISYHWLFTVESCIGSYSSSGAFNWTVGDTDDGFYYAELVDWLSGGDTDTLTLAQWAADRGVDEVAGNRFVYKCEVTVDGTKYYTPILHTQVIPERLVESVRIKGLSVPAVGSEPDTSVRLYGENVELSRVEWLQRNESGSGWQKMEAGENFKEGLYAANIYVNAVDDHHFNFNGRTAVTLNDEAEGIERYTDSDAAGMITRLFQVTDSPVAGTTLNTDYTRYKEGNYFAVVWPGSVQADAWVPSGSIVTIVDASDPKKALVRYNGVDNYIARQYLNFYGYGDGNIETPVGKNYAVWTGDGVDVAWKSPTGPTIARLKKDTVVTAIGQMGPYLMFRYGGYICYAPRSCFKESDLYATDLTDVLGRSGFYRVTASSVNVREKESQSSKRVAGLKKGDIIYAEPFSSDAYACFRYEGTYVYVDKNYLEKVPVSEINELDPVITRDLQDVTVREGETAVFSLIAEAFIYNDYFDDVAGNGKYVYSSLEYGFATSISPELIEEKGWGKVTYSYISNEYRIANCSAELDGMQIVGVVRNFGSAVGSPVTLHVIADPDKEEEVEEDPVIDYRDASISFKAAKRSLELSSGEGTVIDEGMDEAGEVNLQVIPDPGRTFTEDSARNVKINVNGLKLRSSTVETNGILKLKLAAADPEAATATNSALLELSSGSWKFTEKKEVSEKLKLRNSTGAEAKWEIVSGELPEGLTLENGVLTGTPAEDSAGVYPLTVKVSTDRVTETITRQGTREEKQTYTEKVKETFSVRFTPEEVRAIRADDNYGVFEKGYYEYSINIEFEDSPTYSYYDPQTEEDGACEGNWNGDGSLTLTHYGWHDVQRTKTVAIPFTETVEEEKSPACESTAEIIFTVNPSHVHTYKKVLKGGDCESGLSYEYTCECGDTQEATENGGHVYSPWTAAEGDCESGLTLEKSCLICGETHTEKMKPTVHEDMDGDGICDHCYEDLNDEIVAKLAGVSVEEVKDGTWLTVLSEKTAVMEAAFEKAGLEEGNAGDIPEGTHSSDEDPSAKKESFPWRLILLLILVLAAGTGWYFFCKKHRDPSGKKE